MGIFFTSHLFCVLITLGAFILGSSEYALGNGSRSADYSTASGSKGA